MKLVYIICILLTATISSIASNNADTTQPTNQQTARLTDSTAPLGKTLSSTIAVDAPVANNNNADGNSAASNINTVSSTTISTNADTTIDNTKPTADNTTKPSIVPTTADVNTKSTITTDVTTVTTQSPTHKPSTTDKTTETTASTVTKPTVPTTVTMTTVTKHTTVSVPTTTTNLSSTTNIVSSSHVPETTTISMSTKVVPPSTERRFDGLSFVGGIILATCLIAIGALSRKFYKTSPSLNYRTL